MRQMRQIFTTNPWLGPKEGGRRLEAKRNVRDWRNQKLVFFIRENYQKCVFFRENEQKCSFIRWNEQKYSFIRRRLGGNVCLSLRRKLAKMYIVLSEKVKCSFIRKWLKKPGDNCVVQHQSVGEDWYQEKGCQGLTFFNMLPGSDIQKSSESSEMR